ncbi:hypothetical protein GOBAR_AA10294 [Gossypium barbadense]|uniref:Transposase MuDR plant domain-containing protein n=1 Tax=Gossypium barbadense TaxID=3634 RepID=A0A2P5Y478_GOSBA|nr:hypothetical protein GOBAR_AA10294 [Gossypium barbadense]
MELVDDEDVETMIALYCGNRSDKNAPIHLFTNKLAGMEQNEDLTAYGEEHGAQEQCMAAPISRFGVPWRSVYCIRHIAANFYRDYKNADWKRQVKMDVRDAMVANCRIARLINVEIYSRRLETFQVTETIGRRPGIPPRFYGVDLRNRRCNCRRFQKNEFPVLPDLSTWEVPPTTFELVPDRRLRRVP